MIKMMPEPTDRDREMAQTDRISKMLMGAADYFAATLAKADPRAWDHLLVYAPKDAKQIAAARKEGQREERERCAKIVKEIKEEADRDAKYLNPDGDAAVAWADCAATILQEITKP